MLKFKNAQTGFILDQQINRQRKVATLAWPVAKVMADLFDRIGWVSRILSMVAYLVMVVAAGSILASIYNTMNERRREFAILRGDPSDGLPGVRGVGAKTARDLVLGSPSIDALLEAAAAGDLRIKAGVRSRLLEAGPYLDAMRRLVPVNAEAPLSLWAGDRDEGALKEVATELGLKGPVQRLLAAQATTGTG